jgi:tetratricopeptide (TPR) repeat protein
MTRPGRALWNELHNLTGQEREFIKRFESDPTGPAFVAVSDILRKRGFIDESIVVLEDGLRKFPQYHSARAALGKDYFTKGLMRESLEEIGSVLARSPDNLMAQRLRLKLALIFDDRAEAWARLDLLKQLSPDDEFTRMVRGRLAVDDWSSARGALLTELERQGIRGEWSVQPHVREGHETAPSLGGGPLPSSSSGGAKVDGWQLPEAEEALRAGSSVNLRVEAEAPFPGLDDTRLPEAFASGGTLASVRGDADRYMLLRGFRMVSNAGAGAGGGEGDESAESPPRALESMTLAEIYEGQGLHLKALEVYEKLLRENPDSATLIAKAEAARRNARTQLAGRVGARPSGSTPATSDKEEKLRKLERLLSRLEAMP